MKAACLKTWQAWERFFFASAAELPLGLFRFLFASTVLVMYSLRMADWRFYFTDIGFVGKDWAPEILPEFYRPYLTWYPTTDAMAFAMHALLLAALLLLALGLWARWMAILAFILHLAFMQRNFSIAYGADIVSTFFLLGLSFTDSSRAFSLQRALGWVRAQSHPVSSIFNSVGVRLIQIQLCIIYGYTGLEKLKGVTWWDGTAVWAVLGNQQIVTMDMMWLRNFPVMIAAMTFTTVLFEVYFPVLVWLKGFRKWLLILGWTLHGMIALTVGLYFFSGVMMSAYVLFIQPDWLKVTLTKVFNRLKLPRLLLGA